MSENKNCKKHYIMKVNYWVLIFVFFQLLAILNSCRKPCILKDGDSGNSGIIVSDFNFGECFNNYGSPTAFGENEYVISDDSTFQSLALALRYDFVNRPECKIAVPVVIDFSKHSLLGKNADGDCQAYFKRKVERDDLNKQYIYTIEVKSCGICKRLQYSMNWVLVPKLPQGSTVKFEVK